MARVLLSSLLASVLVAGCATSGTRSGSHTDTGTASQIYTAGEEAFANGRADQAVRLWRHALLQLPPTTTHDELRHKLILRIAYGQLTAHHQTGDRAFLANAQVMLLRYLARHQALFGDSRAMRSQRGEVYELLHEVETRLEPEVDTGGPAGPADDPDHGGASPALARGPAADEDTDPRAAQPVAVAARPPTATADHAGEPLGDNVRKVEVGPREDPRVRERLRSSYSDGFAPVVYLPPGVVHGPRPLVRVSGLIRATSEGTDIREGRRRGGELVSAARVALRECYGDAFSRRPETVARPTVELSIHEDGTVSHVRVVDGGLIDALGDVCMIETLQGTTVALAGERADLRIPLVLFLEGAVYFDARQGGALKPGQNDPFLPVAAMPESNRGATTYSDMGGSSRVPN